ncbi:MAG: formylglycine-generating enzyme family protein [Bdellovibrionaceae bacterium]|nr:formylglycine-generating enzyme family protein [Pseudobdellovibrionaceae bacterium]
MLKALLIVFIFSVYLPSLASDLVNIPSGKLRAIWLAPVTAKNKKALPEFSVNGFLMMRYAVTREQFKDFLKNHPAWSKENAVLPFVDQTYLEDWANPNLDARSPVTEVSWFAAKAYCDSLGMRLPTVNEWEYAAAASEKAKDANKNPQFLKRILEWYGEPRGKTLKKVGAIYKNIYGLWDMHGLIWEWVDDFNSSFVTGESRQDSSLNKDMFCGAGAMSSGDKENYAAFMRFAFRSSLKGSSSVWNLGFRCVRDL